MKLLNHLNLEQKNGLKWMARHVEHQYNTCITPIVKLNLKLQCWSQHNYIDAYILLKRIMTITGYGDDPAGR